jgi:hypothetical protein
MRVTVSALIVNIYYIFSTRLYSNFTCTNRRWSDLNLVVTPSDPTLLNGSTPPEGPTPC